MKNFTARDMNMSRPVSIGKKSLRGLGCESDLCVVVIAIRGSVPGVPRGACWSGLALLTPGENSGAGGVVLVRA